MNKKKIALTFLLSALLALLVAFCVLEFSKKPKPIEAPIQPKVEVQAEIPANTDDNKTVKKDAEILPSTTKKAVTVPKPSKQTVKKVAEKQLQEPKATEKVLEEKVEENITPQEDGVIVPVNYVSKNTYKYTYTPKKYPKKVLK